MRCSRFSSIYSLGCLTLRKVPINWDEKRRNWICMTASIRWSLAKTLPSPCFAFHIDSIFKLPTCHILLIYFIQFNMLRYLTLSKIWQRSRFSMCGFPRPWRKIDSFTQKWSMFYFCILLYLQFPSKPDSWLMFTVVMHFLVTSTCMLPRCRKQSKACWGLRPPNANLGSNSMLPGNIW